MIIQKKSVQSWSLCGLYDYWFRWSDCGTMIMGSVWMFFFKLTVLELCVFYGTQKDNCENQKASLASETPLAPGIWLKWSNLNVGSYSISAPSFLASLPSTFLLTLSSQSLQPDNVFSHSLPSLPLAWILNILVSTIIIIRVTLSRA